MAILKKTHVILVLLSFIATLSFASPTPAEPPKPTVTAEPLNCSSRFSGDYYGLGVRLGIYLMWVSSWLANTFIPGEISGGLDANSIFLFALLISIIKGTVVGGSEKLAYIDGLVLMQLCCGFVFGVFSLWGYRTTHYAKEGPKAVRRFGKIGTHCRLGLLTAISVYGIWFWSYGIRYDLRHGLAIVTDENGDPRPPECYPVYIFFFAKLNVLGGIKTLYLIMTSGTALYYIIMLVAAVAERVQHLIQFFRKEKGHAMRETFKYHTGLSRKELAFIFTLNRTFNIFWICYSIVAVELILIWNHVTQVYGPNGNISYPAQLLPLLIGVLGFIRICWLLYKRVTDPPDDCCDENGAAPEKQSGSATAPPVNRQVGLGLLASTYSPARAEANGDDYDETIAHNRSLGMRYMVAYLPWLSQFGFWKNPKGRRLLQSSPEEGSNRYNDSPLAAAQTSYHHSNDTDLQDRGVPSSTDTSPMIDMKSPTSANYSPVMSYKKE